MIWVRTTTTTNCDLYSLLSMNKSLVYKIFGNFHSYCEGVFGKSVEFHINLSDMFSSRINYALKSERLMIHFSQFPHYCSNYRRIYKNIVFSKVVVLDLTFVLAYLLSLVRFAEKIMRHLLRKFRIFEHILRATDER